MKPASKCPTCGRPAAGPQSNPWRPFCSERCRLIDLGDWMAGRHRIPSEEPVPTEESPSPDLKH